MGYIRHHAIVVTGQDHWNHDDSLLTIHDARRAAVDVGCRLVTEVVGPGTNGTSSFLVAPDGSKEGWDESDQGDRARDRFINWLRGQAYDDGSSPIDWAEVVLGHDDQEALIERSAWDDVDG